MMNRYYSFTTGEKISFCTMGNKLGISIEATRQIEIKACLKLRLAFKEYIS